MYSSIELTELVRNIPLSLRIGRRIQASEEFSENVQNQLFIWRSIKTHFEFNKNKLVRCRISFSIRIYNKLLDIFYQ